MNLHIPSFLRNHVVLLAGISFTGLSQAAEIYCDTASEIQQAMSNAAPGDEIIVAAGTYLGDTSTSGHSGAHFYAENSGVPSAPIILRSETPSNPATLKGSSLSSKYVLYLKGNHWEVRDLKITHAQKGVILDNANHNLLHGLEVYDTRDEGVHFRDGSSDNILQSSYVHDTGTLGREGYGEGIYVGTAKGQWTTYDPDCHDNIIRGNRIGPNVGGEHIDIKEGTLRTIVEYNVFDGVGISGEHYADSFIDTKGNDAVIRYNTGYRNGNTMVGDAFDNFQQLSGWGLNNIFYQNIVDLDGTSNHVVKVNSGSVLVAENSRDDGGTQLYSGNYSSYTTPFFYIKPKSAPNYCVVPENRSLTQNTPMVIFTCGTSDEFKWKIINVKDGYVKLANAEDSSKNIKVYQGIFQNNASAVIYEDNNYHSQIWKVAPTGKHLAFESRSNSDYFLKIYDGVFTDNQDLVIYTWNDWGSQKFVLEEI